jgi:hypothetical protein
MVGEARRVGMIGQQEAASLTAIPNIRQKGTRFGNWLTREHQESADRPRSRPSMNIFYQLPLRLFWHNCVKIRVRDLPSQPFEEVIKRAL